MAVGIDLDGAEISALRGLGPLDGLRVLELGCGDGRLTFRYAHDTRTVLAVDPDEEGIAKAQALCPPELEGRVQFAVAEAQAVDAPRASFDLALFSWSL